MNEVKIFVLIPVYNVEKYLDECIQSVINQEYSNYEIILVDDGSTDLSGEICDLYARKNNKIISIHKHNEGLILTRRKAVNFVQANRDINNTYCIFVDSDDYLVSDALKQINEAIVKFNCDMLIYGTQSVKNGTIVYSSVSEDDPNPILVEDKRELYRLALIEHTYNSMCRKAVRTEFLCDKDYDDISHIMMGEDLIQSMDLFAKSKTTVIIPNVIYNYRMNLDSITHGFSLKRFTDDLSSKQIAIEHLKNENVWTEEDFDDYRTKCLRILTRQVKYILSASMNAGFAKEYLNAIFEHRFFQEFCFDGIHNKSDIVLRGLKKQKYLKLYFLFKLNCFKNKLLRR